MPRLRPSFPCLALFAAVLASPLPAAPARAAEATAEQAQAVSRQLRDWLAVLLGGVVPIPPELWWVSAEGERLRLDIPAPPPVLEMRDTEGKPTDTVLSTALRPLDETRWAIEGLWFPARIALTPDAAASLAAIASVPSAGAKPPPRAGTPPTPPPPPETPRPALEIVAARQSASGILDPSLKTESRLEAVVEGLHVRSVGLGEAHQRTEATIERQGGLILLRPTPAGGVDTIADWRMDFYRSVSTDPLVGEVAVETRRLHMRGEITGLMTAQAAQLVQTSMQWGMEAASMPARATGLDDAGRARLKTILASLKNLVAGMRFEQTAEGLSVRAMGQQGEADRFHFAFGGNAPEGKFAAWLDLALDGLRLPALPPRFAALLPHRISLRPSLGNIDLVALTALAEEAATPKADLDAIGEKLKALLIGNGATFGLDDLNIEVGATRLHASGTLTAIGPMQAHGQAEIIAHGFDALMEQAQKIPEARQAIMLLALLRGLARAEGDRLIWRLALTEDQKLTVNGIDLRKLGVP